MTVSTNNLKESLMSQQQRNNQTRIKTQAGEIGSANVELSQQADKSNAGEAEDKIDLTNPSSLTMQQLPPETLTEQEIAARINAPAPSVHATYVEGEKVPASNGEVIQQTSTSTVQKQNLVKVPEQVAVVKEVLELVELDQWIAKVPSMTSKLFLGQLKAYMSDMKPGLPLDSKTAAGHQLQLYRAMNTFLNKVTGEEFTQVWSVVLALFYQESEGVFHDIYVARGFDNVELPPANITAFQNLLHLCKVTADYKVRNLALKQLNLEKALQIGFTDQARQSLLSYYNV